MSGERCPKCGIELNTPYGSGCHPEDGFTCRERQLAQRDNRIAELEAEVERLTEENAHMRTMLKAASAIALMDDD